MRNLWLFLSKYNAFFLFIIFFVGSLVLLVRNNSFQRATVWNSSNFYVGQAYEYRDQLVSYLYLKVTNDSLARENARLKNELPSSFFNDSLETKTIRDSLRKQQFEYIVAKVVNNSIHQENNYITINRGKKHGIEKGMGVIGPSGVVGIVLNVSEHYATIQSLLHSESRISASILETDAFGSLVWGTGNFNARIAKLTDIPNHVEVKRGQKVITSGFALFPKGIHIGRILKADNEGGQSFLDIDVQLSTDFARLQYVYVVKNYLAQEQQALEADTVVR